MGLDSVAHVAPSRAPKRASDRVDGTERMHDAFSSMFSSADGRGSGCVPWEGLSDDKVQVERDVKEVALSVLANEARMARSDEKIRKVKVTELFMETETCRAGLLATSTFKVRVHRLKQNRDVQREALALVTEECGCSSQLSDETAYDENKVVRTRAAERGC